MSGSAAPASKLVRQGATVVHYYDIKDWDAYARRVHGEFDRSGFTKYCVEGSDDVTEEDIAEFESILDSAVDERPLQEYLAAHPNMLVGELNAKCRWVLPQVSLGGRYVADFLTVRLNSCGLAWHLVELESPKIQSLYTKSGVRGRQLAKGASQVNDWRRWLLKNGDMARRSRSAHGLGLQEISPDVMEHYSKPYVMEKKNSPRAAS